jgi:hypothetical protein
LVGPFKRNPREIAGGSCDRDRLIEPRQCVTVAALEQRDAGAVVEHRCLVQADAPPVRLAYRRPRDAFGTVKVGCEHDLEEHPHDAQPRIVRGELAGPSGGGVRLVGAIQEYAREAAVTGARRRVRRWPRRRPRVLWAGGALRGRREARDDAPTAVEGIPESGR